MSLSNTFTTSVRSATYNPEAEKAMQEERKKANDAKDAIQKYLDDILNKGFENANSIASKKVEKIKEIIGF